MQLTHNIINNHDSQCYLIADLKWSKYLPPGHVWKRCYAKLNEIYLYHKMDIDAQLSLDTYYSKIIPSIIYH